MLVKTKKGGTVMEKMERTNLAWDKYMDYLIDAINGSKFMKRAENKPMATVKTPYRPEEKYRLYRKKGGIGDIKSYVRPKAC